jgi:KaiC/GvpD/RAD55 family RecA-like ATPase
MKVIKTKISWIDKVLPEGLPINTSTIITGPGGSGKPLIGETFVNAWLKEGGSVVFMSLQYPNPDFLTLSIKNITGLNLNDYTDRTIFLQLDVSIPDLIDEGNNIIRANLVKPEVWDKTLHIAKEKSPGKGTGVLIFGSALNLLLFSPTYGDAILEKMKETIASDKSNTFIFSVSTSAKANEISELEKAADNLILSRSEKDPFRLYMKVLRVKDLSFDPTEVEVPISSDVLNEIKVAADHSRKVIIPAISKI